MLCPNCGSKKTESDAASGTTVCVNCGAVLEESVLISEVTFEESSSGKVFAQGSHVGESGKVSRPTLCGKRRRDGGSGNTLKKGLEKIDGLAHATKASDFCREEGKRYFKLAKAQGFTVGRKTDRVAAVCLYVACRNEKSSHMLIDFSELLEINVFKLGKTFLNLCRCMSLDLPYVDPSLYISRFAYELDFGDYTRRVVADAVRIVKRMDTDWIVSGRRPAGVCGACLLIAARMNGFRRTLSEMASVAKVAETTIQKRLDEFKKTESAQLPARDFRTTWLDKSADPPSYAKSIQGKQVEETKAGVKRVNEGEEVTPPTKKIRVVSTLNSDAEEQELADIDDEEIESVILTPEEVKQKTQVWYAENKEYIKERLGKREAEDNKEDRPSTKKRRINQAATPAEAAKQLLSTKKFSAKINPDVFDSMFESPESIEKIKMADRKRKEETGELAEPPDYEVVEEPGFMPFSGEANEGDNGEDDDDDDDDDEDDDIDGGYYDANGEVGVDVVGDNYDYDNDDYYFDAYD